MDEKATTIPAEEGVLLDSLDIITIPREEYTNLIREEETLNTIVNIIRNVKTYDIVDTIKAAFPGLLDSEETVPDA